jgi:D-alanine-D-alanine ligase
VLQHRNPAAHEVYAPNNVQRIADALQKSGHEAVKLEGDRHLIDNLERFFAPIADGEWPGLVFNLAFGMQGELRYCHIAGLLEMIGIPYFGSGPWGHMLATDKASAKVIFRHHGIPTPDFVVLNSADFTEPGLGFPVVVKPVAEASSYGVHLVYDEQQLRAAVEENLARFHQPVLVEHFVSGREISVSVIGNGPALEALPPVEVVLEKKGPPIYTSEDKEGTAQRKFELVCPASVPEMIIEQAMQLSLQAFNVLHCRDWARVEFRMEDAGQLKLLELNTMPGLGTIASLPVAAAQVGMKDLPTIVQRLVEAAVTRYQQQPATQWDPNR